LLAAAALKIADYFISHVTQEVFQVITVGITVSLNPTDSISRLPCSGKHGDARRLGEVNDWTGVVGTTKCRVPSENVPLTAYSL
jgi:hypothetical protein